jgi:hypothetical protein
MPEKIPEKWSYWRHYKSKGQLDHVYQVLWIGWHSETQEKMVVYKPQYIVSEDSWAYDLDLAIRPLSMWYDIVDYQWKQLQRFTQLSVNEILSLWLQNQLSP